MRRLQTLLMVSSIAGGLLLAACQSTLPELAAPPNNPNPVVLPPNQPSVINLPLLIDLETVRAQVLKAAPKPLSTGTQTQSLTLANTQLPAELTITHTVNLRDMRLQVVGQDVTATARIDFSVDSKTRAAFLNMGGITNGGADDALAGITHFKRQFPGFEIQVGRKMQVCLREDHFKTYQFIRNIVQSVRSGPISNLIKKAKAKHASTTT